MAHGGAFVVQQDEIGMKKTGRGVTVHNHPKAQLSYYLHTVATLIEMDHYPNLARLRNHQNYDQLTEEETDVLLELMLILRPDELVGKVFFPSDVLCGDRNNQFYELATASQFLAVTDSIVILGQRRRVEKIMAFKRDWMEENYRTPMWYFQNRALRVALGLPGVCSRPERSQSDECCTIL